MQIRTSKRIAAVTLALLAAAQLAGCSSGDKPSTPAPPGNTGGTGGGGTGTGGGGTGGGDTGGNTGGGGTGGGDTGGTPGALTEGVFVDAAVAGLSYATSSNLTGTTDQEGRYEYREGDTVTFSIGDLVLGTVTGQGVVTPMTVAQALTASNTANAETVAVNLLVLLQSLDANGNPDDGITLTPEIRDAVGANSIDLTAAENTFTAALNTFVTSVGGAAGVVLTPVSREDAVEHFAGQAPAALAGHYVRANENFEPITRKAVTLTIFRNGRYLLGGQYDLARCNPTGDRTPVNGLVFSDANGNGVEHGSYRWDPLTNEFAVTGMFVETDGYCGLNEPVQDATNDTTVLEPHAKGLVFKNSDGSVAYRFVRQEREPSTLAGGWIAPTSLLSGQPFAFTFFPANEAGTSGRYLMVDASAPNVADDTSPGIEEGCYSVDAEDNLTVELNASLCADAIDTSDTAGVSNTPTGMQLFIDENDRLVIDDGEVATGFTRLPTRQITHEAMAGSWVMETEPGVALAELEQIFMLTVFGDGRFLFGTQQNDPSCTVGYPTPYQAPDGNGVEYGELSLTTAPGLVVPVTSVDTNGECGLYHNGKTVDGAPFQQRYFVAANAAGDALTMWANDEEDAAGFVFKRVPSVPNQIWGAWHWSRAGATADQFAVTVYLQGGPRDGVMFEASTLPEEFGDHVGVGILREAFDWDAPTMLSYRESYELCVDTESATSSCDAVEADPLEEEYFITGDTVVDDEDGYGTMRRIGAAAP